MRKKLDKPITSRHSSRIRILETRPTVGRNEKLNINGIECIQESVFLWSCITYAPLFVSVCVCVYAGVSVHECACMCRVSNSSDPESDEIIYFRTSPDRSWRQKERQTDGRTYTELW